MKKDRRAFLWAGLVAAGIGLFAPSDVFAESSVPPIPSKSLELAKKLQAQLEIRTSDPIASPTTPIQLQDAARRQLVVDAKLQALENIELVKWGSRLFSSVLAVAVRDSEDVAVRKRALEVLTEFYRNYDMPDQGVTDKIAQGVMSELKFRSPADAPALKEPRIVLIGAIVKATGDPEFRKRGDKILAQDAEEKRIEALEKIKAEEAILDNAIDQLIAGTDYAPSLAIVRAKLLDTETPQSMRNKVLRLFEAFRQGVPEEHRLPSSILPTIPLLMRDFVRFEKHGDNLQKVKNAYADYVENAYSKSPHRAAHGQRGEEIIQETGDMIDAAIKSSER